LSTRLSGIRTNLAEPGIVTSLMTVGRLAIGAELIMPLAVATPESSAICDAEIRQSQAMFWRAKDSGEKRAGAQTPLPIKAARA
jgi:hypothetical protein